MFAVLNTIHKEPNAKVFDCVDHKKLWNILKEILTCLLPPGKGVPKGCILSPCLFNFYAEYIM